MKPPYVRSDAMRTNGLHGEISIQALSSVFACYMGGAVEIIDLSGSSGHPEVNWQYVQRFYCEGRTRLLSSSPLPLACVCSNGN